MTQVNQVCSGGSCYDCLLSYPNQPFYRQLNRHSVRDFLLKLSCAGITPSTDRAAYVPGE